MKKYIVLFITFIITISSISISVAAQKISVIVDNKSISFDVQPYIDNANRVIVPVRFVTEQLGGIVTWDGTSQTVSITKDSDKITLKVGENKATLNGIVKQLDTTAVNNNGRVCVPVRFVSETLGADVQWNNSTYTVIINSNKTNPDTTPTQTPTSAPTSDTNKPVLVQINLSDSTQFQKLASIDGFSGASGAPSPGNKVTSSYQFAYSENNPNDNNIPCAVLSVTFNPFIADSGISICVNKNSTQNMERFKNVLSILCPNLLDSVYKQTIKYLGGVTSDSYSGDLNSDYQIYIQPLNNPIYTKDQQGAFIGISKKQ